MTSTGSDTRATSLTRRDRLALLLLALPYAALVWHFRFVTDDAFITFRTSRHLALGHGPRFNAGVEPPVEGYSNFLWMAIGALFERLGLDVAAAACLLSFACGALLLGRLFRALRIELGLSLGPTVAAAATLALHPPFVVWSTGGLATIPYALLLFLVFELTCLRRRPLEPRTAMALGAALVALALIRVEGGLWALALLGLGLATRRARLGPADDLRRWLAAAGVLLGGFLAWWLWRASYYEAALPNTLYAKAGFDLVRVGRGVDYVLANQLAMLTPLLLVPATVGALRRSRRAVGLPLVLAAWSFPLWSIAVGGDYMTMGRFLVPGAAFTSLLTGWLLADAAGARGGPRRALVGAAALLLVGVGLLPALDRSLVPRGVLERFDFRELEDEGPAGRPRPFVTELEQWRRQRDNATRWAELGVAMRHWIPPGSSYVSATIGASGYFSELFVHDSHGLVTAEVAHLEVEGDQRRLAGHEKGVPLEYFLPLEPDVLLAGVTPGLPNLHVDGWDEERSRAFFVERFRLYYFTAARGRRIEERYVPELHPLPASASDEERPYLTYLRRLGPEEDPASAWSDLEARLERLRSGTVEAPPDPAAYPPRPLPWVPRDPER